VLVQIGLGFGTFYLHLQVEPLTVAHQLIGATLLGTLLAFFILARRDRPISIYHTHAYNESP
jgi:cytochrome c oxidase assembly protein subunit 15